MKVALLVPGPSLCDFWSESKFDEYETVVAVNGAAHLFRSHWFCGVDKGLVKASLDGSKRRPLCGFVTNRAWCAGAVHIGLEGIQPDPYYGRNMPKGLAIPRTHSPDRCGYTFPNALWYALKLATGEPIHVYGFDFAVMRDDADGTKGDHTASRFKTEAAWVRGWWVSSIVVYGRAKPELLQYLQRLRSDWEP